MAALVYDVSREGIGFMSGLALGGLIASTVSSQAQSLLLGKSPSTVGDLATVAINTVSLGLGFAVPMMFVPPLLGLDGSERLAMMTGLGVGLAPLGMVTLAEARGLLARQ